LVADEPLDRFADYYQAGAHGASGKNILKDTEGMAVYRVDFLCDDPEPVFKWQRENILPGRIVRAIAYKTLKGWYIKTVFKRQDDAMTYHQHLFPDESDHSVPIFGWSEAEETGKQ